MKEWRDLYDETYETTRDMCVSLNRVPTCETRSAYDHDVIADDGGNQVMGQWRLDHLLYMSGTLEPVRHWATLESDAESCTTGLPNHKYGSDHLPIGAMFLLTPMPQMSQGKKDELLCMMKDMTGRQKDELCAKEKAFDDELAKIEASLPPSIQEEDCSDIPKKKHKKKKKSNKKI